MSVTIRDIARESGYAVGTVSRVLNHHPDVSETARERIMAVVEAPVRQGDRLGTLTVKRQGETVAEVPILAAETVERVSWKALTLQLLRTALFAG